MSRKTKPVLLETKSEETETSDLLPKSSWWPTLRCPTTKTFFSYSWGAVKAVTVGGNFLSCVLGDLYRLCSEPSQKNTMVLGMRVLLPIGVYTVALFFDHRNFQQLQTKSDIAISLGYHIVLSLCTWGLNKVVNKLATIDLDKIEYQNELKALKEKNKCIQLILNEEQNCIDIGLCFPTPSS